MKTSIQVVLALAFTTAGALGQVGVVTNSGVSPTTQGGLLTSPYELVSAGPNNRVWRCETYETLPNGQVHTNTRSYQELRSGLNVQNGNGNWVAARPTIETYSGGAIARQGQQQLIFAINLNTVGAIDAQGPDGVRLRSTVMGLMYSDATSGQAVQIAALQDSEGELVADHDNEVLYPSALVDTNTGVVADVLYENRLDGMEQNIVIRSQLPDPAAYGMNPATTYLGVFTEFFQPPTASVTNLPADSLGQTDEAIGWGRTILGRGKAFALGSAANSVRVIKRYDHDQTDGRYFLLEKVRYQDILPSITNLPGHASNLKPMRGLATREFKYPRAPGIKTAARPMRWGNRQGQGKGYVLDYTTLTTAYTNFTFQGDTTFFISGTLNLAGASNVFEGGCVIKYTNGASINFVSGSAAVFASQPFHPVVCTAQDDNTVGQAISGSTGTPSGYYANPALNLGSLSAVSLSDFRICYANRGLSVSAAAPAIYDAQFVNCAMAVSDIGSNVRLENVLFSNIKTNFNCTASTNTIAVQNATFNNAFDLNSGSFSNSWLCLTNCVLVNVTNLSGNVRAGRNGFYQSPMVGSGAVTNTFYPLQRAGAASCYLTNGCVFLTNGTTSVDPYDLSLIQHKTVWPPLIYSNLSFSVATNFGPTVQRDTNAAPALGFHYDPLDYAFSGVLVYSNVSFSAGTAVGWFELPGSGGAGYGMVIYDKVVLAFNGTASQPCTLARYCTVQEGGDGLWTALGYLAGVVPESLSGGYSMNATNAAQIKVNFTRHALLAEGPNHYREYNALSKVVAQNSEFWGGGIGAYWNDLYCTNCLFDRVSIGVAGSNPCQYWLRNSTMRGGVLSLAKFSQTWPVWIEDCAFDGTTLAVDDNSGGNTNITYCDFNAFLTNANRLPMLGLHDVTNLPAFSWQGSYLGRFYLPPNSPLINHGSTTADKFGLYQFTTQTNQVKETNSIVDGGYHYAAVGTNGLPIDSNNDGIPDYLADTNGNGFGPWMLAPVITVQPASQSAIVGTNVTFSLTATSLVLPGYQWYFNGTAIAWATNASITLTNVQTANGGSYSVIVSNPAGSATSSTASLTVLVPPAITVQPANVTVSSGGGATFSVTATGTAPLHYQWYFDGVALTSATSTSVSLSSLQLTNTGYYSVTVTNLGGSVTSSNALLTVLAAPVIITQPTNQIAVVGSNAVFTVSATGTAPMNFQWFFNGTTSPTNAQISTVWTSNSIITTFAGNGSTGYTGDGGPAVCAGVYWPDGVAEDAQGNLFIADTEHNVVREVSTNGIITTVAGNGTAGYRGDTYPATNAEINLTYNVSLDAVGNVYIVDGNNNVVRKVATNGIITTVAGSGTNGSIGYNGAATNAELNQPYDAVADQWGNLFIADYGNGVVRKVNSNGVISIYAGNGSWTSGGPGDGGQATNASLSGPASVAVDAQGNLYIADSGNSIIRKVGTNGIISTVAGNRTSGHTGDGGQATNASIYMPGCVIVDGLGNLFIADTDNNVIREVNTNGIIMNVAGNYGAGYSGNGGLATNGMMNNPWSVCVDGPGRMFIADFNNNVIRLVQPAPAMAVCTLTLTNVTTNNAGSYSVTVTNSAGSVTSANASLTVVPFLLAQPTNLMVVQGTNATFAVTAFGTGPFTYQWQSNGVTIPGANSSSFTLYVVVTNDQANYSVVVSNTSSSMVSSNAALWVATPLNIVNSPTNQTVIQGTNVSFSVGITGDYPVYQWYANGVPLANNSRISGATSNTLSISNVAASDAVYYWVVVSNLFNGMASSWAALTVVTNPWVSSGPTNQTAIQSQDVTFRVMATGGPAFQWWVSNSIVNTNISGATSSNYTKLVVQTNDAGWYSVVITNLAGSTNVGAKLAVVVPPWIVLQPTNVVANQGSNATFFITAFGTTNLTYQWLENGTNAIAGATNSSLILSNVQPGIAGGYCVLVTNLAGTNLSAWAWLSVNLTAGGNTNGWGSGSGPSLAGPTVSMFQPPTNAVATNAAVYLYGSPISIRATASSQYSYVTNVAFYFTGTNYGTNFILAGNAVPGPNGQFALAWANALPGTNIVKARAWDCNGKTNDSTLVYVIMAVPPSISAGAQTNLIWTEGAAGTNINLYGTIYNDGQPYSLVTNIQWSVVSGNGQYVSNSNPNSLNPLVTFMTNGVYYMQLAVNNGFATNTTTVAVNIMRRPQIYFNSPTNNSYLLAANPFVLSATAISQSQNISIASVSYYAGTNLNGVTNFSLLGTGVLSQNNAYTYAWTSPTLGTNFISAVATDGYGLMSTSSIAIFTSASPLVVQFVSPTNNQLFIDSPLNILLTATATSYVNSTATSVVFSNRTPAGLLGSGVLVTNATYQFLWQYLTNGSYTVSVTAADSAGNIATNSLSIVVNAMPLVSIITPTNVQSYRGVTNVTLKAVAADRDGTITNVAFYTYTNLVGIGSLVGTNWTVTWSNRFPGVYPVTAVATDNNGASTVSAIAVFQVISTNSPPGIQISYPANNQVFPACANYTITATATNGTGTITNVCFFINGNLVGSDSTSPYSIDQSDCQPGTNIIIAAVMDNAGFIAWSPAITNVIKKPIIAAGPGFWDPLFAESGVAPQTDEVWERGVATDGTNFYGAGLQIGGSEGGYGVCAEWNGKNWTVLDDDFGSYAYLGNPPYAIAVAGTNIYVGGNESENPLPDFQSYLQRWNGSTWENVGDGLMGSIYAIAIINSDVYVGGDFTSTESGNTNIQYIAKLSATHTNWMTVGSREINGTVLAIAAMNNTIFIGGVFTNAAGNTNANYIAQWNGSTWTNVGPGVARSDSITATVRALACVGDKLYVGGDFTTAGAATNLSGFALWNKGTWSSTGLAVEGTVDSNDYLWGGLVDTIAVHCNDVFIAGNFTNILNDNVPIVANGLARGTWNEALQTWNWTTLDDGVSFDGPPGVVSAIVAVNGQSGGSYDVYVTGGFYTAGSDAIYAPDIARWRVGTTEPTNVPAIAIISPLSGSVFSNLTVLKMQASVVVGTNPISQIEFFVDNASVGLGWQASGVYNLTWTPTLGVHSVIAKVTDSAGNIQSSNPSLFTVNTVTNFSNTNYIAAYCDVFTVFANSSLNFLPVLANDLSGSPMGITDAGEGLDELFFGGNNMGAVSISWDHRYLIYTPGVNTYGSDTLYYVVTNTAGGTGQGFVNVNIVARPQVDIIAPLDGLMTNMPASFLVTGNVVEGSGVITNIELFVNGSPYGQTTNLAFSFNFATNTAGFYSFTVVASDCQGYTNLPVPMTVDIYSTNVGTGLPVAILTAPTTVYTNSSGANFQLTPTVSTGMLPLTGSAYDPDGSAVSYQVLLFNPNNPNGTALYNVTPGPRDANGFHDGAVTNGSLGTADLSTVYNGEYLLELVVHGGGNVTTTSVGLGVDSNLKIGQFSFSAQDVILPVNGIPVSVTRSYNSLNPQTSDFGYGWSFAINSMDVSLDEERETFLASGSRILDSDNGADSFNIRVGGSRDVTLTLPDGRRTTFAFTPWFSPSGMDGHAAWTAPAGVTATLTPTDSDIINILPGPLTWHADAEGTFDTHDEPGWNLTTLDGTVYQVTRGAVNNVIFDVDGHGSWKNVQVYGTPKLTSITQRSGDVIEISDSGIAHYTHGSNVPTRQLTFNRDDAGRITAIYDPNGVNGLPAVQYIYDQDNGNLLQVLKLVDRNSGTYVTNRYDYSNANFPHYITSIENGDGVSVARNFYDTSGRLYEVEDANGNYTQFIHNTSNDLEVVVDRLNHTNTYAYDVRGNVIAQTNALNQVTLSAYDANNNKTNEVVYLGSLPFATNSFVYSPYNFLLSSTDPLGHVRTFTYDNVGNLQTSTDARNTTTTNYYDPNTGELTGTSDSAGATTNTYNGNALLIKSLDALGTSTLDSYDSSGNLTGSATMAANGVTILSTNSFAYDANGNLTNSTVWRRVGGLWTAASTTSVYDGLNRVVQTIDPDGGTSTVVYNDIGKQGATIDPLGNTNSYGYDSQGRLNLTQYPDGTSESSAYDANGNRTNSVDRAKHPTTYLYDALNRLTGTLYADGSTNGTVYDGVGRVAQAIDARGTITGYAYDAVGQRLAVTNAVGTAAAQTSYYGYDANGNQTTFTDGLNHTTTSVFDALNRVVQTKYPDGSSAGTAYDAASRRVATTNQDGLVTWFGYDGAGRLTSVTNALQQVTRYQYDEAGNEVAQIDALNRTNTFGYDGQGRKIAQSLPGGQGASFGYDRAGNQVCATNFNGGVITNQFDALNRLTNVAGAGGYSVAYSYTATGQRQTMVDASGTNAYSYDTRDRLAQRVVNWRQGPSLALNYRYDANGAVTNLWSGTPNGVNLAYAYDAQNRLTNVLANGQAAAGYGFDLVGNMQAMRYGNAVTNACQYDSLNRLTNLVWWTGGTVVGSFGYALGRTGNRTNLNESLPGTVSRSYQWQYDTLYRLTNEVVAGGSAAGTLGYQFDAVGNRQTRMGSLGVLGAQSAAYTTNDWLGSDAYDRNGNTLWSTNGTTVLGPYGYDVANRLTNYNSVYVGYDGDGKRVWKRVGTTTTWYLVEDRNPSGYAQVLEEWTNNGTATNLSRVYNYGLNLISQRAPGISTNYFIWDGHGSTRVLADAGGNTVNVFAYDAYGTLIASNGAAGTAYLYCGQQLDADLGLYYNRARYLNVGTGRFCTMDSYVGDTEDPLSLHKYLYCQDSPVNGLDPLGQSFIGFDGTGNSSAEIDGGIWSPTNVRKMFIGSTDPHRHYEVGVGTWLGGNDEIGRGFGAGMGRRMDKAMSELIDDRAQGDNLVDIVGFSRGGIEATEFANRVADAFPDERIRFVGLFDPVGSVGFPGSFGGYRHQLSSRVEYSAEAMAENENRVFFPATDVNVTTKQWFRGVHSDIGGGFANHEISDYVLQWMIQQAQGRGVGINLGVIKSTFGWNPNANGPVNSNSGFTSWFTTSGGRTVLGVTGSYTIQFLSADGFSGVGL